MAYSKKEIKPSKKTGRYYPFGLKHKGYNNVVSSNGNSVAQKKGLGGKELQDELSLEWYDFDARNYDASLGRWMNLDNASEEYYDFSPYIYVGNSPIIASDPSGERIVVLGDDEYRSTVFKNLLELAQTKAGLEFLASTINSKNTLVIQKGKGENVVYGRSEDEDGTYTEYLDYDPSKISGKNPDGSIETVETVLAHEFDHFLNEDDNQYDPVYNGRTFTDDDGNVYNRSFPFKEIRAVQAGNKIRATYGFGLRKEYDGVNIVNKAIKFNSKEYKGKFTTYPTVVKFLSGTKRDVKPPKEYTNSNTYSGSTVGKTKAAIIEKND